MKLPQELAWDMADNRWAAMIEPVINQPINQGHLESNVTLLTGNNVINHKLGRKLIGWFIVGINAPVTVYDTQSQNQTPQLTLQLNSSAPCQVSLWVF